MIKASFLSINDLDREKNKLQAYRSAVKNNDCPGWLISYRHSDIYISSDIDIGSEAAVYLEEVYCELENHIKKNPGFYKSLSPVAAKPYYPEIVKKMCDCSRQFKVGPMAAVAGAVNDYLAERVSGRCSRLIIENGGDLFIKSGSDVTVNLYLKNTYFNDSINILIKGCDIPCGICSSSGVFGHSYSMGRCDLATVIASSSAAADAAATAAANSVNSQDDIQPAIDYFRTFEHISGILLIKDAKIGMWGKFQLV